MLFRGHKDRMLRLAAVAVLSCVPMILLAQSTQGTILGTVLDASGAVVPNAAVTVTNTDAGVSRTVKTDKSGNYEVLDLSAGHYSVSIVASGFAGENESNLTLVARQQLRANATLHVGAVAQQVDVNAASAGVINTETASVDATLSAIDVENLTLDRPALSGKIGLTMDLATTGVSPGALVAGLVGQGEARLAGLKLPRLDPGALERALAKAQAPDALIDETNVQHALSLELDKQSLALPDGAVPLSLSTGVLRIPSIALNVAQGKASVGGSYDLRTGEFRANAAFESTKTAKFWSAPTPQISVTISGSPDAPQRHIDDAGLVAGLAAQAVARDADRIAALEADLRERAAFNRRFKAEAFMDRRAAEIAAFEADQLRKSYEADRARVADALMKAWEEKRAADAAAAAQAAAAQAAAAQAAAAQAAAAAKPPAPVVKPTPPGTPPTDPADPTANGLY